MSSAGDGLINLDEFVDVVEKFQPVDETDALRQAFDLIDKDESGELWISLIV